MLQTWELQKGKIKVVEDASTASLVVVARNKKSTSEKIAALEEIIQILKSRP